MVPKSTHEAQERLYITAVALLGLLLTFLSVLSS